MRNLNRFSFVKFNLFALMAMLGATSAAHAGQGRVALMWSPTYTMLQSTPKLTNNGAFSPVGGGLGLTYMFSPKIGIEVEGFYLQRALSSSQTNNAYSFDALLRLEPVRWFSLGVGGYYDMYSSGTIVSLGSRVSDGDMGFKVGGGLRLPLGMYVSFLTQAFYKMGLNNQASGAFSFKYSMIQGIVGLEFHGASGK
jgi:hypothetical protein